MNILVDTQIVVWSLDNNSPLSTKHRGLLADDEHMVYLSQISLMELAIKKAIGKIPGLILSIDEVANFWLQNGFEILPISNKHINCYQSVPYFDDHKVPFDRFIIATAKEENFVVMTSDKKFELYNSFIQIV